MSRRFLVFLDINAKNWSMYFLEVQTNKCKLIKSVYRFENKGIGPKTPLKKVNNSRFFLLFFFVAPLIYFY